MRKEKLAQNYKDISDPDYRRMAEDSFGPMERHEVVYAHFLTKMMERCAHGAYALSLDIIRMQILYTAREIGVINQKQFESLGLHLENLLPEAAKLTKEFESRDLGQATQLVLHQDEWWDKASRAFSIKALEPVMDIIRSGAETFFKGPVMESLKQGGLNYMVSSPNSGENFIVGVDTKEKGSRVYWSFHVFPAYGFADIRKMRMFEDGFRKVAALLKKHNTEYPKNPVAGVFLQSWIFAENPGLLALFGLKPTTRGGEAYALADDFIAYWENRKRQSQ